MCRLVGLSIAEEAGRDTCVIFNKKRSLIFPDEMPVKKSLRIVEAKLGPPHARMSRRKVVEGGGHATNSSALLQPQLQAKKEPSRGSISASSNSSDKNVLHAKLQQIKRLKERLLARKAAMIEQKKKEKEIEKLAKRHEQSENTSKSVTGIVPLHQEQKSLHDIPRTS